MRGEDRQPLQTGQGWEAGELDAVADPAYRTVSVPEQSGRLSFRDASR
ncbi:hypothetical protein [Streptomyces mirabilis]